jgi:hypothetical protein
LSLLTGHWPDNDGGNAGCSGRGGVQGPRFCLMAVVMFLDECNYLMLSSMVVAATLAAILDKMEGGALV